jgi:acyl dehydratase
MLGLFLEDIDEGLTVELGSYHFTRENILKFARKYDPQPFHLSDEGGLRGPGAFRQRLAHGAGWMKCLSNE